MASFKWEGVARNGQMQSGVKEAANEAAVLQFLRAQQIRPKKIKANKASSFGNINLSFGTGVTQKDLVVFSRQFATMIDAGLPLVKCLDILRSQSPNPAFRKIIQSFHSVVEGG
ncbi:MAG: type II secretion system F family protein, partial [Bdellovibrionota bacterium]